MSSATQQIRFCTSRDGARIAYATSGTGPPLVWVSHWVHHLKLDWEHPVWGPWLSLLSKSHRLIRYDWRGCGLSDRERIDFSLEKYVDDLSAVIEAAGLQRFVLLGMSDGGAVAMAYAVRNPARLSHLVLYCSQCRGRLARSTAPEQVEEANVRLKMIELGWPSEGAAFGQAYTSLYMPDASVEQFRAYNELLRQTTSPANASGLVSSFFRYDIHDIVPQVRSPTLVLHGRGNAIVPFDEGRLVASLIPSARFVPLDSRNHILLENEPAWQQLVAALNDFLPTPDRVAGTSFSLEELTPREREVLEVVAQGLDNGEIARKLGISEKTVRNQVSVIFSKLGFTSRSQAIVRARDAGLGQGASHPS
jgi:pimeloyl-ACP methyl ester carboxylesterase/DNA-binding CsgD family transcriptional regulator